MANNNVDQKNDSAKGYGIKVQFVILIRLIRLKLLIDDSETASAGSLFQKGAVMANLQIKQI